MVIYSDDERNTVADRMCEKYIALDNLREEAKELQKRIDEIQEQLRAFDDEEYALKRAFRLNGFRGKYSLCADNQILDIDY